MVRFDIILPNEVIGLQNSVLTEAKKKEEKLVALRRELHKVPEIGGQLPKTREIVCKFL